MTTEINTLAPQRIQTQEDLERLRAEQRERLVDQREKQKAKEEAEKRGMELLTRLGLKDRADHKPNQLSGGEQQRVAVARALMNQPDVIFADEPSGNLDSKNARELHELFFDLRKEFGQTFVIVTHNEELAKMADRQLVMSDGKVVV